MSGRTGCASAAAPARITLIDRESIFQNRQSSKTPRQGRSAARACWTAGRLRVEFLQQSFSTTPKGWTASSRSLFYRLADRHTDPRIRRSKID